LGEWRGAQRSVHPTGKRTRLKGTKRHDNRRKKTIREKKYRHTTVDAVHIRREIRRCEETSMGDQDLRSSKHGGTGCWLGGVNGGGCCGGKEEVCGGGGSKIPVRHNS